MREKHTIPSNFPRRFGTEIELPYDAVHKVGDPQTSDDDPNIAKLYHFGTSTMWLCTCKACCTSSKLCYLYFSSIPTMLAVEAPLDFGISISNDDIRCKANSLDYYYIRRALSDYVERGPLQSVGPGSSLAFGIFH